MDANEYTKLALVTEFTPALFGPTKEAVQLMRLLHGALGACTETGELQDALKKHIMYGKPLDITNVIEEAGDAIWYLAIIADACGTTLGDVMEKNIAKLKARYGDKFSAHAALSSTATSTKNAQHSKHHPRSQKVIFSRMARRCNA